MRFTGFFLFLLIFFSERSAFAQKQGELTQSRILILLDESSSMIQTWGNGKPKYKAADELILRLMDSIYAVNPQVEFSLRVFGHQHTVAENNCYDTKNEVAFSRDNRVQMAFRLDDIKPLGVTAIAYSLKQAAQYDLIDEQHNAYSIILITDGGESCGGDICGVMEMLRKSKIYFKPYIVSLEDYPELRNTYACMGDYLQMTKDSDIPVAVNTIVNAFRPIIKVTQAEYKKMQTIVANAPSVLKVNVPTITDTTQATKPRKDTVVTPPPAAPAPKPKTEKISKISPAGLKTIRISPPVAVNQKAAVMTVKLPPIADEPAPVPVVVKAAPEKIAKLKQGKPKNFTIYSQYDSPTPMKAAVMNVKLPPLVIDTPKPVVVAVKPPTPEKIARLSPSGRVSIKIQPLAALVLNPVAPRKLPPLIIDTPKPEIKIPQAEKVAKLTPTRTRPVATQPAASLKLKTVKIPALPPIVFEVPAPPATPERTKPAAEKIARLKPAPRKMISVWYVFEEHPPVQRKPPPMPPLKIDIPKLPTGKTAVVEPPAGKKLDYKIDIEEAKVTSLEIYLVNSRGELVTTSPQVLLTDPVTKAEVKKFYRTVDPNGNPDPQENIPLGSYTLTFPAKKNLVIPNVKLEKNKRNKITVKIKNISLSFAYFGDPNRPVKEFGARVIERNKPKGRVQDQLCTATFEYEPGNYHIRINTFPEDVRNIDLDLDAEMVITILQPGFAKFTCETKQIVSLWKEDGNKFMQFHQMDLNDPSSQHKQIQPGKYQVHYRMGPGGPTQSTKVKQFVITSNTQTEVILD